MTEVVDGVTRALVPRQAAEVDVAEAKALADVYLANKAVGQNAAGLFPTNMTPLQAGELARLALMYGLDPMAGELTVYEGKPLVTFDGRMRKANEHPEFDGIDPDPKATGPASEEERVAWRVREGEFLWKATVWRKDRRFPSVGFGRAGGGYERNYLVKNAERGPELARKRAIVNALRMAFAMPLPSAEEEGRYVVAARVIDHRTGEIQEPGAPSIRPTDAQIAIIHSLAAKLGLITKDGDEAYRERLYETCGVSSSMDLSEGDAAAFISMLSVELTERESANSPVEHAGATERPVASEDDPQDLAEIAAQEMGGTVVDTPKASDKQKGYIERLLSDVGIDWAAFVDDFPKDDRPNWETLNVQEAAAVIDKLLARKKSA